MELKIIQHGHFDGLPVWRRETVGEAVEREGILKEANIFIALEEMSRRKNK
jgi:hypothetical protein